MSVIVHISDLHFGTEDPAIAAALLADLDGRNAPVPSLVAISGDLTQRAKDHQFLACRAFLDRLPGPYLAVPGNHDVPLYDLASRFLRPFHRYQQHISEDLEPAHVDAELAVIGINTAHGFTIKDGRITEAQATTAAVRLAPHAGRFRVIVAHHPFVLPAGRPERERVDGADAALPILEAAGAELILSGHLHIAYTSDTPGFRSEDRALVAVHAGTCISTRRRGEPNGYNRLTIADDQLTIVHREWTGDRFADTAAKTYRRQDGRWRRAPEQAATVA
jgi:3',5'-cyclic AMP phosphodiesterase CpdA